MDPSISEFGESFRGFLKHMAAETPKAETPFAVRLRAHFGREAAELPVVSEKFSVHDHANVQMAIDRFIATPGRQAELLGISSETHFSTPTFADLMRKGGGLFGERGAAEGPVQYRSVKLGEEQVAACVESGMYLIAEGDTKWAILIRSSSMLRHDQDLTVEVMAVERSSAEALLAQLQESIRSRNVYRGQVISLSQSLMGPLEIQFHRLASVARTDIILPSGLLERIERQTIGFARYSQKLRAAGQHLRRGILLHGAPGVGKTLTVMYLAKALGDRTTLLLTGRSLSLIEQSCKMARAMQPATVIMEDVDLVAEDRDERTGGAILFELLNVMDGLGDDVDVLFLLTTNRPDVLEPALAARPGRVDQAIELPLPDAECRQQLFARYSRQMRWELTESERLIQRTEGASAAFIRELVRKAALLAAEEEGELRVQDRHVTAALDDLLLSGGELTHSLLGFRRPIGFAREHEKPARLG